MKETWYPGSWRSKPKKQIPDYPDEEALQKIVSGLKTYPPLVFSGEVRKLKKELSKAVYGQAFLFQGGDCAESFLEHGADNIRDFFRVFLQISLVLTFASLKPIVKVGRIAGQFAKPRSNDKEIQNGVVLPVYRGDIINGANFDLHSRIADPQRLEMAYRQSAATLNLLRAFSQGGYANLADIQNWILDFLKESVQIKRYRSLIKRINETIGFMKAVGISVENSSILSRTDFYTSHEALLLAYEESLTRIDSTTNEWYATSGHFLWIGDRTRQLDYAHVDYCRGVKNPLGIKCGPSLKSEELLKLLEILNPQNEAGRITLITRFGKNQIGEFLPSLIRYDKKSGQNVLWACDPMHGNTITENGYKTRPFAFILDEVKSFFQIHTAEGTYPGGIHIEMTGKNVTECTGGHTRIVLPENLQDRYHTHCDPRLNADQALELSFFVAEKLKQIKVEFLRSNDFVETH